MYKKLAKESRQPQRGRRQTLLLPTCQQQPPLWAGGSTRSLPGLNLQIITLILVILGQSAQAQKVEIQTRDRSNLPVQSVQELHTLSRRTWIGVAITSGKGELGPVQEHHLHHLHVNSFENSCLILPMCLPICGTGLPQDEHKQQVPL